MSESNGHAPPDAPERATAIPPIAFDRRRPDGSIELVRLRPTTPPGVAGYDLDTGLYRMVLLAEVVMVYGTVDSTPRGRPGRKLDGSFEEGGQS